MTTSLQSAILGKGTKTKVGIGVASLSVQGQAHFEDQIPNQDRAVCMQNPTLYQCQHKRLYRREVRHKDSGIFGAAVLDGHGPKGELASTLGAERMQNAIHRILCDDGETDLENVARRAFEEVAATLNAAQCGENSGTTGSLALMRNDELVIAHVGDSKVIIVSSFLGKAKARYVTRLHRPTDEAEAVRILDKGGLVVQGYVLDSIARNVRFPLPLRNPSSHSLLHRFTPNHDIWVT